MAETTVVVHFQLKAARQFALHADREHVGVGGLQLRINAEVKDGCRNEWIYNPIRRRELFRDLNPLFFRVGVKTYMHFRRI